LYPPALLPPLEESAVKEMVVILLVMVVQAVAFLRALAILAAKAVLGNFPAARTGKVMEEALLAIQVMEEWGLVLRRLRILAVEAV
jgi:hypothetical protein